MKVFLGLVFLIFSEACFSGNYFGSGKVVDILVRRSLASRAIVYVEGFSDAGNCSKYTSKDLVVLSIKDDEDANNIFSMALAAHMSGKSIKVKVNDGITDADGNCVISDIRFNSQF